MSVKQNPNYKTRRWYNSHKFPLIPMFNFKEKNEHNTSGFVFEWLFLRLWSLDSFQFEISLNIDTHWGIGITAIIPYLRIVFCIPCPDKLAFYIDRKLGRKVARVDG